MLLQSLNISRVRNLESVNIHCGPRANFISGSNGSGKTSLLEAIFVLGRGRSFRHRNLRLVVNRAVDEMFVSAKLLHYSSQTSRRMGIMRSARGDFEARIDGRLCHLASDLARELPIQLVDAHSLSLLEGGPLQRRQFLDWGVFHVEQGFVGLWRRFQKTLKQRNQLLRHGRIDKQQLRAWTAELIPLNQQITEYREQYLQQLKKYLADVVGHLDGLGNVTLEYSRGWPDSKTICEVLEADWERDILTGATSHGIQRADVRVFVEDTLASDCLSRGQSKLLVYALKLAQACHYRAIYGESCVFLLDDLPAELDAKNCGDVLAYLNALDCQYFVTGVDKKNFENILGETDSKLFHVEQGVVSIG